MSQYGSAGS